MTRKRLVWKMILGLAAALTSIALYSYTPDATAQGDSLTKSYTTFSGITFRYPEGWSVTENVEGDYTSVELDNTPSADEKDLQAALDSGEAKIGFYMAPASQMFADVGLPADAKPEQILTLLLDPSVYSLGPISESTLGGAPAARVTGSANDNRFDFMALAGQLSDGTAVIVQANTARGEMSNFEATIIAICDSLTTANTTPPPGSDTPQDGASPVYEDPGGVITLNYPEGWIVDKYFGVIFIANTQAALEGEITTVETGEFRIDLKAGAAYEIGLPESGTALEMAQAVWAEVQADPDVSYVTDPEVLDVLSYDAAGMLVNRGSAEMIMLVITADAQHAVLLTAAAPQGELNQYEETFLAILQSLQFIGDIGSVTEEPVTAVPTNNDVNWQTETVSLSADNFYIVAQGQIFTAEVDGVEVHSDPGDEAYTTLEIEWEEHGVPMRLYIYFESDGSIWQSFEIRTYDGSPDGEWITYEGTSFTEPLGKAYQMGSFAREYYGNGVYFQNLTVQAFTAVEAGTETPAEPTPAAAGETIVVPAALSGPADCRNVAVSIGDYSSQYSEAYTPANLLDGDPATGWSSAGDSTQVEYVVINLEGMPTIYGILFNSYSPSAGYEADSIQNFSVETTTGGQSRVVFKGKAALQQGYQSYTFDPVETDHLRFLFTSTHGGSYFEAADIMVCAAEAPVQAAAAPAGQEIRQWASQASASSQYSDDEWSATQATGAPDTPACGDFGTAWASSTATGIDELLVLFDTPVLPTQINIYQTYNPGAISSIKLLQDNGSEWIIPNSADPGTGCPGIFSVAVPDALTGGLPIDGVVILLDQSDHTGWNEIDAVELVGTAPGAVAGVNLDEQLAAARALFDQKDYAGAVAAYDAILIVDPANATAYFYRGASHYQLANYEQTVIDFTLALAYQCDSPANAYRQRGLARDKLGNHEEAITDLTEAIRLDPEYELAYQNRAYVYINDQDWEKALADYERAAEIDPSDSFNYNGIGWVLQKLGRDDEALEALTQAITLNPKYEAAYQNRAYIYYAHLQEWELAMADYERAAEIDPTDSYNYNGIGWALVQLGRYDEALEPLNRSLDLDPNYIHAWDSRGWAYLGLKNYDLAIADFEKALALGNTYSYFGLGRLYYELGDMTQALENLQRYVDNAGDSAEQEALDLIATIQAGQTAANTPLAETQPLPKALSCPVVALRNANLRSGPGTNYNPAGQLTTGTMINTNGQADVGDGYTWRRLTNGAWVRSDLVEIDMECYFSTEIPLVTVDDPLPLTQRYTTPEGYSFDYPQDWALIEESGGATIGNSPTAAEKPFGEPYAPGEFQISIRWMTAEDLAPDTGLTAGATPMQLLKAAISVSSGIDLGEPYELAIGDQVVAAAYGKFMDMDVEIGVIIFDAGNGMYGSVLTGSDLNGLDQFEPTVRAVVASALGSPSSVESVSPVPAGSTTAQSPLTQTFEAFPDCMVIYPEGWTVSSNPGISVFISNDAASLEPGGSTKLSEGKFRLRVFAPKAFETTLHVYQLEKGASLADLVQNIALYQHVTPEGEPVATTVNGREAMRLNISYPPDDAEGFVLVWFVNDETVSFAITYAYVGEIAQFEALALEIIKAVCIDSEVGGGEEVTAPSETVALAQSHTTQNGQISFGFPEGWLVYEDLNIPYIYNSPEAQSALSIGLKSGQVALQITQNALPGMFGADPSEHIIAYTKSLVDYLKLTQTAPTAITINGHSAAYALATSDSWSLWGIAVVVADDRMIEVLAYTAPGEFEQYEPVIMAIVESVVYTP